LDELEYSQYATLGKNWSSDKLILVTQNLVTQNLVSQGVSDMRRQQQGITAIGFVILACFLGLFVFAFLRLTPIYLEHMKITSILNDVKAELDGTKPTIAQIKSAINKRMDIEMVRGKDARNFKIAKSDTGYSVAAKYDSKSKYVANIYLLVEYDKTVEILQ
jgi:hypothetical protein